MLVTCEECGKQYTIDPSKIKGDKARFKCNACDFIITIIKPAESAAVSLSEELYDSDEIYEDEAEDYGGAEDSSLKSKGFGLRTKMVLLFFLIPIILIVGANLLFLGQMNSLSSFLMSESSNIVQDLIEEKVGDSARKVAAECSLYIKSHPKMKKQDFNKIEEFKELAIQKVGKTGYSALYEMPGEDGIWRTWVHVNGKIVGIDMMKLKKPLGKNFAGFWKVYAGIKKEGESRGYYTWHEKSGAAREKFMVCAPVKGTSFVVAATTYVDEFTGPVVQLETKAKKQALMTRNIVFAIFGGSVLLIGFIVSFFGYKLAGRIRSLTESANRISIGEMNAAIQVEGNDEIGDLGEAISRMRESIRISLKRLRQK